uniref:tRNA/rRNA methyltransferase SpoU type domain-containing protein n=1 Tax=Chromera velia CCMP2878 TaxID=1169474 RepID=A0A0G4HZX1_9ALVE|eukprot:Cvel_9789.t1-p1 / transcript=Cvel_9789.t1 / gene=Cvel_9789 / organism=Chromera_velia_CCMP2878 / gene_product=Probable methyltransferase TARBP1, putative / transcript_product=Probable methyltransferase TARBP1, putative / location=Cvel_scaffold574:34916-53940(+) / protein_length=2939 / sequence_SO=supercontig / SO=protein_coding / is_pseudo=false
MTGSLLAFFLEFAPTLDLSKSDINQARSIYDSLATRFSKDAASSSRSLFIWSSEDAAKALAALSHGEASWTTVLFVSWTCARGADEQGDRVDVRDVISSLVELFKSLYKKPCEDRSFRIEVLRALLHTFFALFAEVEKVDRSFCIGVMERIRSNLLAAFQRSLERPSGGLPTSQKDALTRGSTSIPELGQFIKEVLREMDTRGLQADASLLLGSLGPSFREGTVGAPPGLAKAMAICHLLPLEFEHLRATAGFAVASQTAIACCSQLWNPPAATLAGGSGGAGPAPSAASAPPVGGNKIDEMEKEEKRSRGLIKEHRRFALLFAVAFFDLVFPVVEIGIRGHVPEGGGGSSLDSSSRPIDGAAEPIDALDLRGFRREMLTQGLWDKEAEVRKNARHLLRGLLTQAEGLWHLGAGDVVGECKKGKAKGKGKKGGKEKDEAGGGENGEVMHKIHSTTCIPGDNPAILSARDHRNCWSLLLGLFEDAEEYSLHLLKDNWNKTPDLVETAGKVSAFAHACEGGDWARSPGDVEGPGGVGSGPVGGSHFLSFRPEWLEILLRRCLTHPNISLSRFVLSDFLGISETGGSKCSVWAGGGAPSRSRSGDRRPSPPSGHSALHLSAEFILTALVPNLCQTALFTKSHAKDTEEGVTSLCRDFLLHAAGMPLAERHSAKALDRATRIVSRFFFSIIRHAEHFTPLRVLLNVLAETPSEDPPEAGGILALPSEIALCDAARGASSAEVRVLPRVFGRREAAGALFLFSHHVRLVPQPLRHSFYLIVLRVLRAHTRVEGLSLSQLMVLVALIPTRVFRRPEVQAEIVKLIRAVFPDAIQFRHDFHSLWHQLLSPDVGVETSNQISSRRRRVQGDSTRERTNAAGGGGATSRHDARYSTVSSVFLDRPKRKSSEIRLPAKHASDVPAHGGTMHAESPPPDLEFEAHPHAFSSSVLFNGAGDPPATEKIKTRTAKKAETLPRALSSLENDPQDQVHLGMWEGDGATVGGEEQLIGASPQSGGREDAKARRSTGKENEAVKSKQLRQKRACTIAGAGANLPPGASPSLLIGYGGGVEAGIGPAEIFAESPLLPGENFDSDFAQWYVPRFFSPSPVAVCRPGMKGSAACRRTEEELEVRAVGEMKGGTFRLTGRGLCRLLQCVHSDKLYSCTVVSFNSFLPGLRQIYSRPYLHAPTVNSRLFILAFVASSMDKFVCRALDPQNPQFLGWKGTEDPLDRMPMPPLAPNPTLAFRVTKEETLAAIASDVMSLVYLRIEEAAASRPSAKFSVRVAAALCNNVWLYAWAIEALASHLKGRTPKAAELTDLCLKMVEAPVPDAHPGHVSVGIHWAMQAGALLVLSGVMPAVEHHSETCARIFLTVTSRAAQMQDKPAVDFETVFGTSELSNLERLHLRGTRPSPAAAVGGTAGATGASADGRPKFIAELIERMTALSAVESKRDSRSAEYSRLEGSHQWQSWRDLFDALLAAKWRCCTRALTASTQDSRGWRLLLQGGGAPSAPAATSAYLPTATDPPSLALTFLKKIGPGMILTAAPLLRLIRLFALPVIFRGAADESDKERLAWIDALAEASGSVAVTEIARGSRRVSKEEQRQALAGFCHSVEVFLDANRQSSIPLELMRELFITLTHPLLLESETLLFQGVPLPSPSKDKGGRAPVPLEGGAAGTVDGGPLLPSQSSETVVALGAEGKGKSKTREGTKIEDEVEEWRPLQSLLRLCISIGKVTLAFSRTMTVCLLSGIEAAIEWERAMGRGSGRDGMNGHDRAGGASASSGGCSVFPQSGSCGERLCEIVAELLMHREANIQDGETSMACDAFSDRETGPPSLEGRGGGRGGRGGRRGRWSPWFVSDPHELRGEGRARELMHRHTEGEVPSFEEGGEGEYGGHEMLRPTAAFSRFLVLTFLDSLGERLLLSVGEDGASLPLMESPDIPSPPSGFSLLDGVLSSLLKSLDGLLEELREGTGSKTKAKKAAAKAKEGADGGGGKAPQPHPNPTPMPCSDIHRRQVRGWQAVVSLCLFARLHPPTARAVLDAAFAHLSVAQQPDVRQYIETVACSMASLLPAIAAPRLIRELQKFDAPLQCTLSFLTIAAFLLRLPQKGAREGVAGEGEDPEGAQIRFPESLRAAAGERARLHRWPLLAVVFPWLTSNAGLVRGAAQFIVFACLEKEGAIPSDHSNVDEIDNGPVAKALDVERAVRAAVSETGADVVDDGAAASKLMLKGVLSHLCSARECAKMRSRTRLVFEILDPLRDAHLAAVIPMKHLATRDKPLSADLHEGVGAGADPSQPPFIDDHEVYPGWAFSSALKAAIREEMTAAWHPPPSASAPVTTGGVVVPPEASAGAGSVHAWGGEFMEGHLPPLNVGTGVISQLTSVRVGVDMEKGKGKEGAVVPTESEPAGMDVVNFQRKFMPLMGAASGETEGVRLEGFGPEVAAQGFQQDSSSSSSSANAPEGIQKGRRSERRSQLVVVASLIDKAPNVAGLTRTCEIFQAEALVIGSRALLKDPAFQAIAVSAERWTRVEEVRPPDLSSFLQNLRAKGYFLVGLEQTQESVSLNRLSFPEKTAVVLGAEKFGLPAELIPLMDVCTEIPQFGVIRSLNVHVSAALCVWEYTRQHRLAQSAEASAAVALAPEGGGGDPDQILSILKAVKAVPPPIELTETGGPQKSSVLVAVAEALKKANEEVGEAVGRLKRTIDGGKGAEKSMEALRDLRTEIRELLIFYRFARTDRASHIAQALDNMRAVLGAMDALGQLEVCKDRRRLTGCSHLSAVEEASKVAGQGLESAMTSSRVADALEGLEKGCKNMDSELIERINEGITEVNAFRVDDSQGTKPIPKLLASSGSQRYACSEELSERKIELTLRDPQVLQEAFGILKAAERNDSHASVDPDTRVLLFDGSTKAAKDVREGDELVDDWGQPTRVQKVYSGTAEMYDIIPTMHGQA